MNQTDNKGCLKNIIHHDCTSGTKKVISRQHIDINTPTRRHTIISTLHNNTSQRQFAITTVSHVTSRSSHSAKRSHDQRTEGLIRIEARIHKHSKLGLPRKVQIAVAAGAEPQFQWRQPGIAIPMVASSKGTCVMSPDQRSEGYLVK
jgi:hypothetical protein